MANSSWLQTPSQGNIAIKVDWTQTQDVVNNKSTITYNIYGVETGGTKPWVNVYHIKLWNGGTVVYQMDTATRTSNGTQFINGGTFEVAHNTDGTASMHLWLEAAIVSASINSRADWNWELDRIPRAAKLTLANDITDESNGYIEFDNPLGSIATLDVCLTSWNLEDKYILKGWQNLYTNASSATVYFSQGERENIQKWLNYANSDIAYYYLRTTINGEYYYNYIKVNVSIVNGALSISPTAKVDDYTKQLTKDSQWALGNYSSIIYNLGCELKKFATIKSITITNGTQTSNSETGKFYWVNSGKVVFSATDSRGNTVSKVLNLGFTDYKPPTIDIATSMNAKGEMALTIKGTVFDGWLGNKSAKYNEGKISYICYEEGTTPPSDWKIVSFTPSSQSYNETVNITGLSYEKTYVVQARITDSAQEITYTPYIYSAQRTVSCRPVFQWGKDSFKMNVPLFYPQAFPTYPANEAPEGVTGMGYFNRYGFCWSRFGNTAGKTCEQGDNYYLMISSSGDLWVGTQTNGTTEIIWTVH